uniref:mitogen-activated protein kinase kinase n=1 Tax=Anopheles farauti TaxID=69004 RepID=A0A182R134_9DIPT
MLPTGTHHQPGTPSDGRTNEVGGRNGTNDGTMSGSSLEIRITKMEQMIQSQPQRPTPTLSLPMQPPTNAFNRTGSGGMGGGSGPNRPSLPLHLPIVSGTRRNESEQKFQKIVDKSGLLKINEKIYRTQLSDLEDLGELGNGTSGHVVKMRHNPSGAIIAVKQMRRTGNDEENKRIIMDLDVVLKSENCKYIVKCLGCLSTDADVWICMELMTTCFDKLQKKSKKPVPEEILAKVTVATVRALAYLKDNHRVIHRDVKPSNILIDDRGNIKLCDFGISGRLVDSNARTRSAGCAAYMAPERIDPANTAYDIRSDVWSLGITLVELATGVFPYRGCVTDFEVLTQVLTSKPPRLPEDQPFSPEFRDFVQLCLQKDYQARPKYPDLLRHAFLQRAEHDTTINVGEWFRNVAVNCGIQLTSPPQQQQPASVGTPPTWTASSEQTSVPVASGLERNGSLGATEPARKYKHSPFLSRRTASEYGAGSPKKESTLSSLGQSIFKNLTTSPFAQRKSLPPGESKLATSATASSSAAPPMGSGGIYANGAGAPGSNPSSPLLLLRKAHDVPGSETDTQYKHLQGNTSPIGKFSRPLL